MKDALQLIIDDNLYRLQEDLDKMSPGIRWSVLEKLKKYVIPTMSQTKNDVDISGEVNITVRYEDDNGDDMKDSE